MALSAAGLLALATRDNALLAYDIERAQLSPWSAALAKAGVAAPAELAELPGQICGLSFDPSPGSSVVMVGRCRLTPG
jgi:U3 small nucleolar RNA-associated protein 4